MPSPRPAGALDVYYGSSATGTPTVFTAGADDLGTGEVNFTDGTVIGLGDVGDTVEYLGLYSNVTLDDDGTQTIYGGPTDTAYFMDGDPTPDSSWDITADKGAFLDRYNPMHL